MGIFLPSRNLLYLAFSKKKKKITLSGLFQLLVKENLEKAKLQLKPFGFESGMT